jgi:hypothetical protein
MNLNDYISSKTEGKQKAIPAEIRSKFEQRNGLSYAAQGERGAIAYISQFGKGLGAPKAVFQGRLALEAGFPEFAAGFFKKAAELEGVTLEVSDVGNTPQKFLESAAALVRQANVDMGTDPRFPRNMQPGRFAAMQPSDAKHDRSYYINDDCYWGQPKKDGEKLIVS